MYKLVDLGDFVTDNSPRSPFITGFIPTVAGNYKLVDSDGREIETYLEKGFQYGIPHLRNIKNTDGSKVTTGKITLFF